MTAHVEMPIQNLVSNLEFFHFYHIWRFVCYLCIYKHKNCRLCSYVWFIRHPILRTMHTYRHRRHVMKFMHLIFHIFISKKLFIVARMPWRLHSFIRSSSYLASKIFNNYISYYLHRCSMVFTAEGHRLFHKLIYSSPV